jgi:stage II sporulation protein Q
MKDEQNNQQKNASVNEEEVKPNRSGWKRMFKRKWFFPAVYLAAAALILALITWFQNPNDFEFSDQDYYAPYDSVDYETDEDYGAPDYWGYGEDTVPVDSHQEQMMWPVASEEEVQVVLGFFDDNATEEEQAAAILIYENSYHPHKGINLQREDNESFPVLAALSGEVIAADKDPLVGYYVEIKHEDNLVTIYQSLADLQVEVGDKVSQGEPIAVAGRNIFEKEYGVHLHFEVRENGVAVNPDLYLSQEES